MIKDLVYDLLRCINGIDFIYNPKFMDNYTMPKDVHKTKVSPKEVKRYNEHMKKIGSYKHYRRRG